MKILKADYITSAVKPEQYPSLNNPEFIFFGRSNVGKSSFINALTNRKNLAYTSSKPGKTLTLNFYLINDSFTFIDVPGYGYAEKSMKNRTDFGKMIESYLKVKSNISNSFLLIDSKIGFTEDDLLMLDFLMNHDFKPMIISTKIDKLNQKEQSAAMKKIADDLSKYDCDFEVFVVSSEKKLGLDIVLEKIENILHNTNNEINGD